MGLGVQRMTQTVHSRCMLELTGLGIAAEIRPGQGEMNNHWLHSTCFNRFDDL